MNAQILEHPALAKKQQRAGLLSALEITEEMFVLASTGKWDDVRKLEAKRRDFLDQCLSRPVEQKDLQLFSDALGTLLQMNDKLVSCVQDSRDQYELDRSSTQKAVALASKYLDS